MRHQSSCRTLRAAALAASISALLLTGCVTNKPAVEALTDGVAPEETDVPVDAASLAHPGAAAAARQAGAGQAARLAATMPATQPGTTAAAAQPGGAPMVGGDGTSVVMEGTGLKAVSSSIFSVGQPAAAITPGASGPAGGSLFRSQPATMPVSPMPVPPMQGVAQPLVPAAMPAQPGPPTQQGAALAPKRPPASELALQAARDVAAQAPSDPAASLVGLFAGARKAAAAPAKRQDPKALQLAAHLSPQQVAVLSYGALPGIRARSMFATVDDEAAEHDDRSPRIKLASLSGLARLAPNGLIVQTETVETGCFQPALMQILKGVETRFGRKLVVTSGHRSLAHNIAVGGATRSHHLTCEAADIQVPGVSKWELASYLRSVPGRGGVGTYCHTESVHIDTGRQRDWNWPCKTRDA